MNRRTMREHIFRMVFQRDFYNRADLPEQYHLYLEELEADQKEKDSLMERAIQIADLSEKIDKEIDAAAESWRFARIGKADLAILRLAVYEIKYDEAIPVGVAINEAVELAKKYGGERSYGFINGVLAKFAKEIEETKEEHREGTESLDDRE